MKYRGGEKEKGIVRNQIGKERVITIPHGLIGSPRDTCQAAPHHYHMVAT